MSILKLETQEGHKCYRGTLTSSLEPGTQFSAPALWRQDRVTQMRGEVRPVPGERRMTEEVAGGKYGWVFFLLIFAAGGPQV